jgi:hypothetical protein
MRACHFGGFLGFFGRPILLRCRRAMSSSPAPVAILTASTAADGAVLGTGGWFPVARNGERDHGGERQEPAEDECGSFSYTALRGKDQEERRERERFERDGQTDENEVKNHGRLGLLGEAARILPCSPAR